MGNDVYILLFYVSVLIVIIISLLARRHRNSAHVPTSMERKRYGRRILMATVAVMSMSSILFYGCGNRDETIFMRASKTERLHQYAEAREMYEQLLDQYPSSEYIVQAKENIEICQYQLDAEKLYTERIELEIAEAGSEGNSHYQESVRIYQTILDEYPDFYRIDEVRQSRSVCMARIKIYDGDVASDRGDYKTAIHEYQEALILNLGPSFEDELTAKLREVEFIYKYENLKDHSNVTSLKISHTYKKDRYGMLHDISITNVGKEPYLIYNIKFKYYGSNYRQKRFVRTARPEKLIWPGGTAKFPTIASGSIPSYEVSDITKCVAIIESAVTKKANKEGYQKALDILDSARRQGILK